MLRCTLAGVVTVSFGRGLGAVENEVRGAVRTYARTFCVVYREGVAPTPLASVHSSVTIQRTPFFLAQTVTWRGASGLGFGAGASLKLSRHPRKADVNACIAAN